MPGRVHVHGEHVLARVRGGIRQRGCAVPAPDLEDDGRLAPERGRGIERALRYAVVR